MDKVVRGPQKGSGRTKQSAIYGLFYLYKHGLKSITRNLR